MDALTVLENALSQLGLYQVNARWKRDRTIVDCGPTTLAARRPVNIHMGLFFQQILLYIIKSFETNNNMIISRFNNSNE